MSQKKWTCGNLTKEQICFLDKVSKDCKFSGGGKMRRTSIIRSLLTACKGLEINLDRIKSEDELKVRILSAFKKY
ncbi:MAG: hypothetical protein H6754_06850 [Candidatus Omnitrophica bacterium]|nr:hypothetical protein [Candidatus Omnitrophota bacterium]